jgi:hypothetical protein
MPESRFGAPVMVRVNTPHGPAVQAIEDVRALSEGAVGEFRFDWPDFSACLETLGRAVNRATP